LKQFSIDAAGNAASHTAGLEDKKRRFLSPVSPQSIQKVKVSASSYPLPFDSDCKTIANLLR
jgi:hypothetical protein